MQNYYTWFGIPFPENFDLLATRYNGIQLRYFELKKDYYFQFIRNNKAYVARAECIILYHGRYLVHAVSLSARKSDLLTWFSQRFYKNLERKDPATHLPLLQVDSMIIVPADKVTQLVVVLPSEIRYHSMQRNSIDDAELIQKYFLLCTEFD